MRISDWSSDVCSSDLTWTLRFSACPRRTAASSKCVSNKTTQGDTLCKIVQSFTSSAASAKSTPRNKSTTSTSPPTIPAGTAKPGRTTPTGTASPAQAQCTRRPGKSTKVTAFSSQPASTNTAPKTTDKNQN